MWISFSLLIWMVSRTLKCWQVLHGCRALRHVWAQLICKASWSYCKHGCWLRWLWALLSLTCFVSGRPVTPPSPSLQQCTSLLWRCWTPKAPRCVSQPAASSPTWPWSPTTGPASRWRGPPSSELEVLTCWCTLTSGGNPAHANGNTHPNPNHNGRSTSGHRASLLSLAHNARFSWKLHKHYLTHSLHALKDDSTTL